MRRSDDFKCFLLCATVLPFCSSRDTLSTVSRITYPGGAPLVSADKRFEFGFFSPNGSTNSRRYVGIWYYRSDLRIIVWVANRNVPLIGRTATFGLLDGDLQLWNDGQPIWSTNVTGECSSTRFAKLLDTGNLVLMEDDGRLLGQARMTQKSYFTFQRDQAGDASKYKVMQNQHPSWKSGVYGKFIQADEMFDFISFLLSNFTMTATLLPAQTSNNYSNGWLVMNYDGHIQYFMQGDGSKPVWSQPRGRCSVFNACNKLQRCNDKNGNETMCKKQR